MARSEPTDRHAVVIGHPSRHIEQPIAARFEREPHPDVLTTLLRAGYVVYRETCHRCGGVGKLGNSMLDCSGCEGRGMPAHLLPEKAEGLTVCGFCKGRPVGDAATWVDGKPRPPAPCPRCGETNHRPEEMVA